MNPSRIRTSKNRRKPLFEGALAALVFLPLALQSPAAFAADWLVLLVDRSNSIDREELKLQREAYVRLLSDEAVVAALDQTRIAIVEFDTRAEVVVNWSSATKAAAAYSQVSPDGLRGQTAIGNAVKKALMMLAGKEGRKIIDISGDGRENRDERLLIKVRRKATEQQIMINGLVITEEEGPELLQYFDEQVATGFVLPVASRGDFYIALRAKLYLEIAGALPPNLRRTVR